MVVQKPWAFISLAYTVRLFFALVIMRTSVTAEFCTSFFQRVTNAYKASLKIYRLTILLHTDQ